MPEKSLLEERLLASPAFIRDLKSFLSLPEDVLLAISELGNGPEGFSGVSQSETLKTRFDIPIDKAMRALRIAEHLYHRVTDLGLNDATAADQIISIISRLDESIEIDNQKRKAIEAVLSFKRAYEISNVTVKALENVPHFLDVNGSWNIKIVRTREGEIIKVPVVTMSVVWHDHSINHRQAFFYMDEEDWDEFNTKMKSLADNRKDIEDLL